MTKAELAKLFKEMAVAETFIGDSPFKSRTYLFAAEVIEKYGLDVEILKNVKGVGKAVLNKTNEYFKTGKIKKHDYLMKLIPGKYAKALTLENARLLGKEWKSEIMKRFFSEDKTLRSLPSKHLTRFYVLKEISSRFKRNHVYTETEINKILMKVYKDNVALRRYLVDYGFLKRTKDGSEYKRGD